MSTVAEQAGEDIETLMRGLGEAAQAAARELAYAPTDKKNQALKAAAAAIRAGSADILAANALDMNAGEQRGLTSALLDRLKLDDDRIEGMAAGLDAIANLADPVGAVMDEWSRPNSLRIERVRVPLGVVGIIYESRPNVTADAGALCLKAGNAAILRGGTEAYHSNHAIMACLAEGLAEAGLPAAAIQLVPTQDREAVGSMLRMAGIIDVVIPRGGRSLVERVQNEARVPVFAHLDGICHTYIHAAADLERARAIALNAKMRRTGICGAMETLLIDRAVVSTHLGPIADDLIAAGCELRGDAEACAVDARIKPASEDDWGTEYLDAILSVRVVSGLDEAMDHIATYGSNHTEAIVTEDSQAAERFLNEVGSAILMHNTSTQYADGGEFGMGAEIGISTGKLHARGPVGVEQLTSFKYVVRGEGQVRP
ncbi:MAG: glutamate-5-semialdehyde dehydrogenase [Alphaproteobacteria bacterium]